MENLQLLSNVAEFHQSFPLLDKRIFDAAYLGIIINAQHVGCMDMALIALQKDRLAQRQRSIRKKYLELMLSKTEDLPAILAPKKKECPGAPLRAVTKLKRKSKGAISK